MIKTKKRCSSLHNKGMRNTEPPVLVNCHQLVKISNIASSCIMEKWKNVKKFIMKKGHLPEMTPFQNERWWGSFTEIP